MIHTYKDAKEAFGIGGKRVEGVVEIAVFADRRRRRSVVLVGLGQSLLATRADSVTELGVIDSHYCTH